MLAPSTAPIFAPPYEAFDEDAEVPLAPEASETGAEISTEAPLAPEVKEVNERTL